MKEYSPSYLATSLQWIPKCAPQSENWKDYREGKQYWKASEAILVVGMLLIIAGWLFQPHGLAKVGTFIKVTITILTAISPFVFALFASIVGVLVVYCYLKNKDLLSSLVRLVLLCMVVLMLLSSGIEARIADSLVSRSMKPSQDLLTDRRDWPISQTFFYDDRQYHIKNTSSGVATAFYNAENNRFSDFRLTITTTEVSGSFDSTDFYGIIFRSATSQNRYYFFEINTCCGSGLYYLYYYNGQSKQKLPWSTLEDGPIAASSTATLGKTITITVVAKGSTFEFFVNGKSVGKPITDHSGDAFLKGGEIGLGVEGPNTEVAFSHLYISKLS